MARLTPGEILARLNEPQREAVVARDGPLLILAGPGAARRASSPTASPT